jgi:curli production assembly/transport component CsgG
MSRLITLVLTALLSACSSFGTGPVTTLSRARFEPTTNISSDLSQLPLPKGRISVAVYGFRDQTGQYKQSPDSSFSTAVSQGGAAMLVKALNDSRWFTPVEREGLQDLLTERKLLRALEQSDDKPAAHPATTAPLPSLTPARLLIEGAVVGYDFNVSTGGFGIKYLGLGASDQFRKDQVTVNLRAVDTSNGRVLHSVSSTKTVYSQQVQPGVYKFVSYKKLLEVEAGYTYNEPVQMAVQEAIEAALLGVIVEGIYNRSWVLADDRELQNPLLQRVRAELLNKPVPAPVPAAAAPVAAAQVPAPVPAKAPQPVPEAIEPPAAKPLKSAVPTTPSPRRDESFHSVDRDAR